jgi:hypothetical protein
MFPKWPLYEQIALLADFPGERLKKGDIVRPVEFLQSPTVGLPNGYCVEAFNAVGDTIGVFMVQEDQLEALTKHDVLSKRMREAI